MPGKGLGLPDRDVWSFHILSISSLSMANIPALCPLPAIGFRVERAVAGGSGPRYPRRAVFGQSAPEIYSFR